MTPEGRCGEHCFGVRRGLARIRVQPLRALPINVARRPAHRLGRSTDRVHRPHPPRMRIARVCELRNECLGPRPRWNRRRGLELDRDRRWAIGRLAAHANQPLTNHDSPAERKARFVRHLLSPNPFERGSDPFLSRSAWRRICVARAGTDTPTRRESVRERSPASFEAGLYLQAAGPGRSATGPLARLRARRAAWPWTGRAPKRRTGSPS